MFTFPPTDEQDVRSVRGGLVRPSPENRLVSARHLRSQDSPLDACLPELKTETHEVDARGRSDNADNYICGCEAGMNGPHAHWPPLAGLRRSEWRWPGNLGVTPPSIHPGRAAGGPHSEGLGHAVWRPLCSWTLHGDASMWGRAAGKHVDHVCSHVTRRPPWRSQRATVWRRRNNTISERIWRDIKSAASD